MVETVIVESEVDDEQSVPTVSWPAIVAGAVVTLAGALLMLALGSGLGFSVLSPWSSHGGYAGETTKAATVAGIYLTATSVLASAVGGYLAGRLRPIWFGVSPHEAFFRDTAHGLISWAVAAVAGAALLGSAAASLAGGVVQATSQGIASRAAEGPLTDYTDRLFAYDERNASTNATQGREIQGRDFNADRIVAERLLTRAIAPRRAMADEERRRLATIVAARTGMALPDAEKRVGEIAADARQAADTARLVAARLSFWLVASMFAGALAASLAAWEGGAIRDGRLRYGS
jgi:hypothetical protein